MGNTFFWTWEVELIEWIQAGLGPAGRAVASFFTLFGEQLMCVLILGFIYWCWSKEMGRYVGLNALVGILLYSMVKNVFVRRRPYMDHPQIKCLRPVEKEADIYDIAAQGYSFPSGHATNSVTIFTSMGRYEKNRIIRAIGIMIPLLCGISRFCLGVHYPTDVLAGWLIGFLLILVVPLLARKITNQWLFYGLIVAAAIPGWFFCRSDDYYSAFGILIGFILGVEFEKRFVHFENTRSPLISVLRVLGGTLVYFGLNYLLKLSLDKSFLVSGTMAAFTLRTLRYGLCLFVIIGVYPMLFRLEKRFTRDASQVS
ncbi:MAG: phosphatase PAP2 family protein [Blautia sp.]|nr:phosphatase PAP2 family protein [Blautia sp.]